MADGLAHIVFRAPVTEPAYIAFGRLLWRIPLVKTLYGRSTDTLTGRLRASGRQYRPVQIGPHRIQFDVTHFTARGLYFLAVPYEPGTISWMLRHLRAGDAFVDVGANHGFHTVIAAAIVGERGHVFACEPNPEAQDALWAHVRLNGFDRRVTLLESALADRRQDAVELFLSGRPDNNGIASLDPLWEPIPAYRGRGSLRVRTERFDDWRRVAGIDGIALVKIDVEGAEELVLCGMTETLLTDPPPAVICETSWGGPAYSLLIDRGYAAEPLDWIGEEFGNILFTHRRSRPAVS